MEEAIELVGWLLLTFILGWITIGFGVMVAFCNIGGAAKLKDYIIGSIGFCTFAYLLYMMWGFKPFDIVLK